MNTPFRIRTVTMSLVALVTILVATNTFAAVNMYLEIKDNDGKITTVNVKNDGSFTTPPLPAGTYTFSWGIGRGIGSPMGGSADRGISSPTGGSADRESSAPSVSEITVSYDVKSPRDAATGLSTGRRMHKPFVVTISPDARLLPTVNKKLGTVTLDTDCDGISGTVSLKDQNGKKMAMDDWSVPSK